MGWAKQQNRRWNYEQEKVDSVHKCIFDDLTAETKKYQRFLDSGFKKKSDITGLEASGARINNLLKRLKVEMGKISQEDLTKSF